MSSRFLNISTDNTLGGNSASDEVVSSQKAIKEYMDGAIAGKQDTLVSGTNIKTINGSSVLGSGDLTISATASFASLTGDPGDNENLVEWFDAKANTDLSNLDATGKSYGAGLSMPSDNYVDLTLEPSGYEYTAPATGYYVFSKYSTAANQYYGARNDDNGLCVVGRSVANGVVCGLFIPVKKGDKFIVDYALAGATLLFRFIYAEGEI